MANNGKGIGPNRLGAGRGSVTSPAKQKMVAAENMTVSEKKKMKDNSVFGPDGKNVALPPYEKKKLVKGSNKKDEKKPAPAPSPAKQRAHQKASKKLTLSDLGNKNAEVGFDGKMTIISANMAKNQKMIPLMKLNTQPDLPLGKLRKKKDNKSAKSPANKSGYKG